MMSPFIKNNGRNRIVLSMDLYKKSEPSPGLFLLFTRIPPSQCSQFLFFPLSFQRARCSYCLDDSTIS